ncbi:MAG: 4-hydroxy-3-methylbut-2-enyl diphosphate reductase [Planctomycetes bacterium]|nr:4-hydroxy-3-methylbut-2-enyl diphosphate reductase [Planctomycetota bacterium]
MEVLLANPRCYCAGVDRAVQIVELAIKTFGSPVFVRKEIVHNQFVVNRLRDLGAVFVDELGEVPPGSLVVFSAHGVAPSVHEDAKERRLRVIDASCPLVSKVHMEVLRFVGEGYHIIFIGRAGHEEVEGTMGHAPGRITLVEDIEQARTVELPKHDKLMVLTQTTLSVDDTNTVVSALRERFDYLDLPPSEDICYATQNRQDAVKQMCEAGIGLLLVVGSHNSSNAARLVEVAKNRSVPGYRIDNANELDSDWLTGIELVGLTGGASTPDEVVQSVVDRLKEFGAGDVRLCTTAEENVVFQLPVVLQEAEKKFPREGSSGVCAESAV